MQSTVVPENTDVLHDPTGAASFGAMTYPRYRSKLSQTDQPNIVAVGSNRSEPQGLALAEIDDTMNARLLSLYVKPSARKQGIGRDLVRVMQEELLRRGVKSVSTVFADLNRPVEDYFVSILQREGWSRPEPYRMKVRGEREALRDLTRDIDVHPRKLPKGWSIVGWDLVTQDQAERVRQRNMQSNWYDDMQSPFQNQESMDQQISVALVVENEIRGWMTCHHVDEQTLQYSVLFVDPALNCRRTFVWLLEETYRRHLTKCESPLYFETTFLGDCSIAEWLNRKLAPDANVQFSIGTYQSEKHLISS